MDNLRDIHKIPPFCVVLQKGIDVFQKEALHLSGVPEVGVPGGLWQ